MGRALACGLLLAACGDAPAPRGDLGALDAPTLERVLTAFHRGVGQMDRFEARAAIASFDEVLAIVPHWTTARLDLGIALLNAEDPDLYPRAEAELRRVVAEWPDDPRGPYTLGMLLVHLTRWSEAEGLFRRVLELDPDDPDTHYQVGALLLEKDPAAARRHLEIALTALPHHESACYRLFRLHREAGDEATAEGYLERFRALKDSGAGEASSITFGAMGRYADLVRVVAPPGAPPPPTPPEVRDVTAALGLELEGRWPAGRVGAAGTAWGPGVALADVDGDGDLDLYAGSLAPGEPGTLWQLEAGRFVRVLDGAPDATDVIGATFGDADGDGDADLYLTRDGPNALFRNDGGRFVDITAEAGVAGGDGLSLGAAWADADHDGDLDLFVAQRGAPDLLFLHLKDGRFAEAGVAHGVAGGTDPSVSIAFLDLDGDRDLDLLVVADGAPGRVHLNDRAGVWRDGGAAFGALTGAGPGRGVVVADVDGDGLEDVLRVRGTAPTQLVRQGPRGRYTLDPHFTAPAADGVLCGDLDLDGVVDLVLVGVAPDGHHEIRMGLGNGRFGPPQPLGPEASDARGAVAADLDGDGGLELIVLAAHGPAAVWSVRPRTGHHALEVVPSRADGNGTLTGEAGALGLRVEVQAGGRLQVATTRSLSGYLGGTPARVHVGLGGAPKADYVRLLWPDAVLQSELEVAGDRRFEVQKVERKPSSCPLLFAWDGEGFAFVTDILGVGGLGFFVEPGVYAPPDPTEDVLIPAHQIALKDGRYLLRINEPLEEVTYLDALHLRIYDHPASTSVVPDERFAASAPLPTGRPQVVRERIPPVRALDHQGRDVTATLQHADRDQVEPPTDPRFTGYAADHALELDFGDRVPAVAPGQRLLLGLQAWVEYTYSHVNYAAWQAGLVMRAPSIEVPDGDGGWRVAIPDAGFPAGLPRLMTVDVTDLGLAAHGRLRLRSNMEVFVDAAFLAVTDPSEVPVTHRLDPERAVLRFLGYPREYSPDGRLPTLYDYARIDPGLPFKLLTGDYTRFGDVRELLRDADDRSVIFGRGEEIELAFDARGLPPLPPGWARTVVLHVEGWCKDMDLYTAYPDTVEPLPFRAMDTYPPTTPSPATAAWADWRRTWNTRRVRDGR
jgi:Tfp pilus assembly protein PilF